MLGNQRVIRDIHYTMPARLRMNRIARPKGEKVDFELFCLAVSAINGCEMCVRSHEAVVVKGEVPREEPPEKFNKISKIPKKSNFD